MDELITGVLSSEIIVVEYEVDGHWVFELKTPQLDEIRDFQHSLTWEESNSTTKEKIDYEEYWKNSFLRPYPSGNIPAESEILYFKIKGLMDTASDHVNLTFII